MHLGKLNTNLSFTDFIKFLKNGVKLCFSYGFIMLKPM